MNRFVESPKFIPREKVNWTPPFDFKSLPSQLKKVWHDQFNAQKARYPRQSWKFYARSAWNFLIYSEKWNRVNGQWVQAAQAEPVNRTPWRYGGFSGLNSAMTFLMANSINSRGEPCYAVDSNGCLRPTGQCFTGSHSQNNVRKRMEGGKKMGKEFRGQHKYAEDRAEDESEDEDMDSRIRAILDTDLSDEDKRHLLSKYLTPSEDEDTRMEDAGEVPDQEGAPDPGDQTRNLRKPQTRYSTRSKRLGPGQLGSPYHVGGAQVPPSNPQLGKTINTATLRPAEENIKALSAAFYAEMVPKLKARFGVA